MTTEQILENIQPSISVSRDSETGQKWMWAGPVNDEADPTTAACIELQRRGVLTHPDTEDGYHVWEIAAEWVDKIR